MHAGELYPPSRGANAGVLVTRMVYARKNVRPTCACACVPVRARRAGAPDVCMHWDVYTDGKDFRDTDAECVDNVRAGW